jgi:hypothetical protein
MKAIVTAYLTRETRNGNLSVSTEIPVGGFDVNKARAAARGFYRHA